MSYSYLDDYDPPMPALEIYLGYPEEGLAFGPLTAIVLNRLRLLLDGPAAQVKTL
jgi:hypothetical protein